MNLTIGWEVVSQQKYTTKSVGKTATIKAQQVNMIPLFQLYPKKLLEHDNGGLTNDLSL